MKFISKTFAAVLLVVGLGGSAAIAATVDLHRSVSTSDFGMGNNETRETLVEVLNTVSISDFSASLSFNNASSLAFSILNSTSSGAFGSVVATTNVSAAASASLVTTNSGLSATLTQGFYIFQMQALNSGVRMERFNESAEALPFVTTDGNFRIINGGANNFFGNTILPAFSVTTGAVTPPVPLPAGLPMLLGGIAVLGALRRRKTS